MQTTLHDDIETALRELLTDMRLNGHGISRNDDLPAAGLTSLATVDLMLAIEDRFGVEFPEHMLNRRTFATLSTLAGAVNTLRGAA